MNQQELVAVKQNIEQMYTYSLKEFSEFEKTSKIVFLQQACEKLFNVLENYIQYTYKFQVMSFYELRQIVKQDKELSSLLLDGRNMHRFFYRGELEMNATEAKELFLKVKEKIDKYLQTI